jgi:hypothetical protein
MRTRSLRLSKETLHELTTGDLADVVGASGLSCGPICLSNPCSDFKECFSAPGCLTFDGCFTGTTNTTQ